ncbi:hypothetical protein [Haliscomenobacter sp.]|uniref:hypothetical protein n=1 Tax=Haliscomenobacter sp. TaxID=2717303 RepID=UPI002D1FB764|nr:hypothetical protein [Haliscomenobacter sp.]
MAAQFYVTITLFRFQKVKTPFKKMKITDLKTHNNSHERAFEAFCNQLFERWVRREYKDQVSYFTTVRGDGGDGGVEAYAILKNGEIVGVQSKWFPLNVGYQQINKIKSSIKTAKKIRPALTKYIICLPKDLSSLTGKNKNKGNPNTEEERLKSMSFEIVSKFPDLELVFWTEHHLFNQLQFTENEGIKRFWFEKSEISQELLLKKFEIARAGWLKERYVPKLHLQGDAENSIEDLLLTTESRTRYLDSIDNVFVKIARSKKLLVKFNEQTKGFPINQQLKVIFKNLEEFEVALNSLKQTIALCSSDFPPNLEEVYLWDVKLELERGKFGNKVKGLQDLLSEALAELHQANLPQWLQDLPNQIAAHNLILMGEPGIGKTHILAFAVEKRLEENYPALIIQAQNTPCNNWAEILQNGLGSLTTWTFDEICTALEALASRTDAYRTLHNENENLPAEPTCVLIAIDGIDEVRHSDYSNWKTRLNELKAIIKQYPRLRFLISCRSYGIANRNPVDLDFDDEINQRQDLTDGLERFPSEVTLKLIPLYLQEYEVKFEGLNWLKYAFRTPLELRLFCESYKGQNISQISKPIHTTLKHLIQEKMYRMEEEFTTKFFPPWTPSEQVFKKFLIVIAKIFSEYDEAEHESLCQEIQASLKGVMDRNWAGKILEFTAQHGVLLQLKKSIDDVLEIEEISYSPSYTSYIDYFLALRALDLIVSTKSKKLPTALPKNNQNSIHLTAVSLLNDHDILIGENGYWVDDFDELQLHFMQYQALAEGSIQQIQSRLHNLEERFKTSRKDQALILQEIVLPHIVNKSLNLGREFIHKILSGYTNSFERDLMWSGDEWLRKNPGGIPSPSNILQRIYGLEQDQAYDEQPLILAWGLSALDNHARKHFRKELTKWGAANIPEFVKLLDLMFSCQDPQIQEDLTAIGLGIVSITRSTGKGLDKLAKWMIHNVFDPSLSCQITNSVIRHGARACIERAFQLGEISFEDVLKAHPPYCNSHHLLPLDLSTITEGNTYPIGDDLEWYVIKKSYEDFLELGEEENSNSITSNFLRPYMKHCGIQMEVNEWAVAAAKAYILSLGFNLKDRYISTEESHGSLSKIMTLEEKYVWLAVHKIQGYLADFVPYKQWDELPKMLEDYSQIVHIQNPVAKQMLLTVNEVEKFGLAAKVVGESRWFVPEEIAPILVCKNLDLKEDLLTWVNTTQQPDFKRWIESEDFFIDPITNEIIKGKAIHGSLSLAEANIFGRTSLHYVCILMEEKIAPNFVKNFKKNHNQLKFLFRDLDSLKARTVSTYFSPDDLVWMDWVSEECSRTKFDIPNVSPQPFESIHTVVKVADRDATEGEEYFKLPSKFIRQQLGIVSMGYNSFFDANENQIAWSLNLGKSGDDNQEFVFVDSILFEEMLKRSKLKPLWFFFQFKSTTAELKKDHKDAHAQNCKFWLVWEERGNYKNLLFHDGWFRNE